MSSELEVHELDLPPDYSPRWMRNPGLDWLEAIWNSIFRKTQTEWSQFFAACDLDKGLRDEVGYRMTSATSTVVALGTSLQLFSLVTSRLLKVLLVVTFLLVTLHQLPLETPPPRFVAFIAALAYVVTGIWAVKGTVRFTSWFIRMTQWASLGLIAIIPIVLYAGIRYVRATDAAIVPVQLGSAVALVIVAFWLVRQLRRLLPPVATRWLKASPIPRWVKDLVAAFIFLFILLVLATPSLRHADPASIWGGIEVGALALIAMNFVSVGFEILFRIVSSKADQTLRRQRTDDFLLFTLLAAYRSLSACDPRPSSIPAEGWLSFSASVFENELPRSRATGDVALDSAVASAARDRATTIRDVAQSLALRSEDSRETAMSAVRKYVGWAAWGNWGAFPPTSSTAPTIATVTNRALSALRFAALIVLLLAALYYTNTGPLAAQLAEYHGSITVAIVVLLAQLVIVKLDPSTADLTGGSLKFLTRGPSAVAHE